MKNRVVFSVMILWLASVACSSSAANTRDTSQPPVTPTVSPVPLPTDSQQQATVTADALHVRTKPNYKAALVWYLERGDIVTVTGACVDGWSPVKFGEVTGFVNANFLSGDVCK